MQVDKQFIALKGLIVNDEGNILIIKESKNYQDGTKESLDKRGLPGGRLDKGEKREDGLLREIKEETGLIVSIQKPLYVGERHPKVRGEQRQIVGIFFLCRANTKEVSLSQDHEDYKRIDPKQHTSYVLLDPEDKVVENYLSQVNS